MNKIDILSMMPDELGLWMKKLGQPAFRSKQLFDWLHKKDSRDFENMTNLPKGLVETLKENARIEHLTTAKVQVSADQRTRKFLFGLSDGQFIETVSMQQPHGHSVCLSTQAGCAMGCTFCASGIGGLVRNLTPAEMLEQLNEAERQTGVRVSHVVLMGTGEPLDNYDNVLKWIRLAVCEDGKNISQRHITLSTCGLVPQIRALADEKLGITLAISLHAPNDALRSKTMPVSDRFAIDELLTACEYYFETTKRRITFEYSLIKGVNDKAEHGRELASILKKRSFKCHVNLIPINPVKEMGYESTERKYIDKFMKILTDAGIETTVRRSLGAEIDAACGQLRL